MKEMIYGDAHKEELLTKGKYNGISYYVISYGTHPCAYLGFSEDSEFFKKNYMDVNIDCHGGLTFSGQKDFINEQEWLLGWDYAHFGDQCSFMEGRKWTTAEIVQEIMGVIDENELEA